MINRPLYVDKIMAYVDTPFVKILTGVRRCGKSTILKMIMEKLRNERGVSEEQIVSYRFDSMEYEDMTAKEMYRELKSIIVTLMVQKHVFVPMGKPIFFWMRCRRSKGGKKSLILWPRIIMLICMLPAPIPE